MPRSSFAAPAALALVLAVRPPAAAAQQPCDPRGPVAPAPLVLDGDRIAYALPLLFRCLHLPDTPVSAVAFDARTGQRLALEATVTKRAQLVGLDAGGGGMSGASPGAGHGSLPHLELRGPAGGLAPGEILVDFQVARGADGGSGAGPLGTLRIPVAAPAPGIRSVEFIQDGQVSAGVLRVVPNAPTRAEIRVSAERFLPGARLELDGFDVADVRVLDARTLAARLRLDAAPAHRLPIGPRRLRVRHDVGGEEVVEVLVRGPRPAIPEQQVVEVPGGPTTVALSASDLAEGASVRVEPAEGSGYRFPPFFLPARGGRIEPVVRDLPPLPGPVADARVTAVNPDGERAAATVRFRRAPAPTLAIEPGENVGAGESRRFALRPLDRAIVLDPDRADRYVVRVGDREVELVRPTVDDGRSTLHAYLTLPSDLAAAGAPAPARVTLAGPGIPGTLAGTITLVPRPEISPTTITLRPGEERTVIFDGRFLSGTSVQSRDPVAVAHESWSTRSGHVTFRVNPTAPAGTTVTLDLDQAGAIVGRIAVRIAPWADREALVAAFRYAPAGDPEWKRLEPGRDPALAPSAEFRFRVEPIAGLAAPQLVRARIEKDGQEVWRDSVFATPGAAAEFARAFRPADHLEQGDRFTLVLEGQGGAHARHRFRAGYEGGFHGLGDPRPVTGISTLQLPLTDGYSPGVFDGVVLGTSVRFAPLSRRLGSDVIRLVVLGTASTPARRAGSAADGGADSGAAAEDASIAWGASIGILVANTLYATLGYDSGGSGPGRRYLSLGTAFRLDALGRLVRSE